jgi:hypothetical protein
MALRGGSRLRAFLASPFALASLGVMAAVVTLPPLNSLTSGHRGPRPDRPVWIWGQIIGDDCDSRFFDADSGRMVRMTLPGAGELKLASGSPWQEEDGTWQVVGIWTQVPGGASGARKELSLVRLSQPGGRILDRVDPEIYPSGPPCWSPGTSARVLFTGTDGRLFAWAFEGPLARDAGGRPHPRPLVWLGGLPADDSARLEDLCVLTDPCLCGRLLVTLRHAQGKIGGMLEPTRLWWLELDSGSNGIVRAGRLRPESSEPPGLSERFPRFARTSDGRLILAYLREEPDRAAWQLRLAPVAIDEETGDPTLETAAERTLARECLPTAPVFSADARWVSAVLRADPRPRPLRRFPVDRVGSDLQRPGPTGSANAPCLGNAP